jgi:hypothetical protein
MTARRSRTLLTVSIVFGWLLARGLLVGCSSPTEQSPQATVDEPASTSVEEVAQPTVEQEVVEQQAPPASAPEGESAGALSIIRMIASPDPNAEGQEEFPANSEVWIAFYALEKGAAESDEYKLRVEDASGAAIAEIPLYGPERRLPDGSESATGTGGFLVQAAVPVFGEGESPAAGDYRSVILANGVAEAELSWSVTPIGD